MVSSIDMIKRPLPVTLLACLYLIVGAVGFVGHFSDSLASPRDGVWIELTELLAFVAGVFLLRAHNWARWLAVAWIAFHVVLSWGAIQQLAIHCVFLVVIAWGLFYPASARYFRGAAASA
jgi:hypothetical protein